MLATRDKLNVESTLSGERIGMTIDEGALAHIMSVLTDLYSDPAMAVIREYSTNAYDSHIWAGVKRPIEITSPTSLSPFFKVRDFGVGLSADDIREIYSRYGASTKRESDDVVGMLGLGCKSALTYTNQFALTGVKDGVLTTVSVSRDGDGGGSMTIVDERETDASSGVEVIVPSKYTNDFNGRIGNFFRFWEKGTVLVNGCEPDPIDGLWVAPDLLLTDEVESDFVVMGNVPYPLANSGWQRMHKVAFVPIGAVHFTPSREALQYTSRTKETVQRVKDRFKSETPSTLLKLVNEAKDRREAIHLTLKARQYDNHFVGIYKGEEVPQSISPQEMGVDQDGHSIKDVFVQVSNRKAHYERLFSIEKAVGISKLDEYIWFVGYESERFTSYKKQKLTQWAAKKGMNFDRAIFSKLGPDPKWVGSDRIYNWADVEAEKIVRGTATTASGRPAGSYDVVFDGRGGSRTRAVVASLLDTNKPLFWMRGNYMPDTYLKILEQFCPHFQIVLLTENRVAKFKRDFPMAELVSNKVDGVYRQWYKGVTQEQWNALHVLRSASYFHIFRGVDPNKVDDPDLKEIIRLSGVKVVADLVATFDKFWRVRGEIKIPHSVADPFKRYPLLTGTNSSARLDHIYIYVNAVFAAEKEN
jgi:hypothetical protein